MKFRFETILRLRQKQEDLAQKEMAVINDHLQTQQGRLRFMQQIEAGSKSEFDRRVEGGMNIDTFMLYDDFYSGVQSQENLQSRVIAEVAVHLESKRKLLVEAMRKRRTMEILKDRETEAYKQAMDKRETALMDEAASNQWRLKSL